MEEENLGNPATTVAAAAHEYSDDVDSCCSTPYVSAPSSPGRGALLAGFYYSAPTSPTHFVISTTNVIKSYPSAIAGEANSSFEFDFSATFPSTGASSPESMTSADELFFNGQIRPMKLSTHLQSPQILAPLIESENDAVEEDDETLFSRGRDSKKLRAAGSLRRRTRSMSPLRSNASSSFQWRGDDDVAAKTENNEDGSVHKNGNKNSEDDYGSNETTPCASRSSSSRRWIFLKEFLYRSKSEGARNESHNTTKFWGSLSFSSPVKDKKMQVNNNGEVKRKGVNNNNKNGVGKSRRNLQSAHEIHYTAKRAQAEEMRKKTFLPYRQGLLGCLGFSSKSYGAMNGFARALNTVSSR